MYLCRGGRRILSINALSHSGRTQPVMPQTTLGRGLKLSSNPPSPSKPVKPKNNSKLTPAVAAAKANGNQGKFAGKESSIKSDLELLGLPSTYLESVYGEKIEQAHKGDDEVQDNPKVEEVQRGKEIEQDIKVGETNHDKRAKDSISNYAPTKDDVDIEDPDHRAAERDVQGDIPSPGQQEETGNASMSHVKRDKKESTSKQESGNDVSGTDAGKGKKRAPSPDEGGAAGDRGKRHKAAYEVHQKIAHAVNAARVDREPPLDKLLAAQEKIWGYKADGPGLTSRCKPGTPVKGKKPDFNPIVFKKAGSDGVERGESVVYWMRMEDVRG
jgi:hypothetical protein